MKLASIRDMNSTLYLERYVNDKAYSQFSSYSAVNEMYRPESLTKSFRLPFFRIDEKELQISTVTKARLTDLSSGAFLNVHMAHFFVHPETLTQKNHSQYDDPFLQELLKRNPDGYVQAITTSSTRTVYLPEHGVYIKLHLPKRISRFQRRIHEPYIKQNIELAQEVMQLQGNFGILPDVIGVSQKQTGWGFIVRDGAVYPSVPSSPHKVLIPGFSLYGTDAHNDDDPSLLNQIISTGAYEPLELARYLNKEILTAWWAIYTGTGLIIDLHGQNILFELDPETGRLGRVILRDFYANDIDEALRSGIGLKPLGNAKLLTKTEISHRLSNVYDYHYVHHFLEFLARSLQTDFSVDPQIIQDVVKQRFNEIIDPLAFPPTTYKYANKTFEDGSEEYLNTSLSPVYR